VAITVCVVGASGLSVPCGTAQVIDLSSILGHRTSARLLFCNPLTRYSRSILRSGGIGSWFQIHTESRSLNDFDEAGWASCYMRIAALLRVHPEILGTAGRAWFYDLVLETMSPPPDVSSTTPGGTGRLHAMERHYRHRHSKRDRQIR
jgi:hypothetical protein